MAAAVDAAQPPSNKRRLSTGPDEETDENQAMQGQPHNPFKLTPPAEAELFDFKAFILDNQEYKIGENLSILSTETEPYYGELLRIQAMKNDRRNVYLTMRWFYRPHEIIGGRRPYHGENELLKSVDHTDRIHVASVIGPCHIVNLVPGAEKEITGFYWREEYTAVKGKILTELPRYCTCSLPENPDLPLIQCDSCEKWFHADCVGFVMEEFKEEDPWYCPECEDAGVGEGSGGKGPVKKQHKTAAGKAKPTKKQASK
ncbi:hypothetical protein M427DRAFT_60487 [Gonapodya prolifera JEL478]|uniref:BAH-domain-containing protein n=1 Tax=Gonapodya prolifera (strain JEL478) TaxID=1344416 RepID=A0A139A478_GONPJ|nr:hypothetical protein M427DRAFT_60487 [Gonapodya prolifera JEL478]|eukprot:KXS11627.1 hypothetical protein M427DRAFT_60487 [Gonapodya prolifera JEL478]